MLLHKNNYSFCFCCSKLGNWRTLTKDVGCIYPTFGYFMHVAADNHVSVQTHICEDCAVLLKMANKFFENYIRTLHQFCCTFEHLTLTAFSGSVISYNDITCAGPASKTVLSDDQVNAAKWKYSKQAEQQERFHYLSGKEFESQVWRSLTTFEPARVQTYFNDTSNFRLPITRKMYLPQTNGARFYYSVLYDLDATRPTLHTCLTCNKSFLSKNNLTTHIEIHAGLRPPHQCLLLTSIRSFNPRQNLLSHSPKRSHLCHQCNKFFARKDHLNRHLLTHTAPKRYKCTFCTLSFLCISALHRHCGIEHGHKRFLCAICRKSFALMSSLKQHQLHHSDLLPYTCAVCNKSFKCKAYMRRHVRSHDQHKPFSCVVCKRSYSRRSTLNEHNRIHAGNVFLCSLCNKAFSDRKYLRQHFLVHTGEKPFSCPVCHKSFSQNGNLKIHLRIHSDEKPFSCSECDALFSQKNQLDKHVLLHRGEAPFSCTICQKSFRAKSYLKEHILIHSDRKPFPCLLCQKSFVTRSKLNKHVNIHNTKIDVPVN